MLQFDETTPVARFNILTTGVWVPLSEVKSEKLVAEAVSLRETCGFSKSCRKMAIADFPQMEMLPGTDYRICRDNCASFCQAPFDEGRGEVTSRSTGRATSLRRLLILVSTAAAPVRGALGGGSGGSGIGVLGEL